MMIGQNSEACKDIHWLINILIVWMAGWVSDSKEKKVRDAIMLTVYYFFVQCQWRRMNEASAETLHSLWSFLHLYGAIRHI